MHGFNGMSWGMGFGWIIGILLLFALIWIATRMIPATEGPSRGKNKTALEILKEKYARGEIDEQEYERIRKNIS